MSADRPMWLTAGPRRTDEARAPAHAHVAELAQMRIRMIALENLVIALLAEQSDGQRDLARDMASYISPRPGFTRHRATLHAAAQMVRLVERAAHFRHVAAAEQA